MWRYERLDFVSECDSVVCDSVCSAGSHHQVGNIFSSPKYFLKYFHHQAECGLLSGIRARLEPQVWAENRDNLREFLLTIRLATLQWRSDLLD